MNSKYRMFLGVASMGIAVASLSACKEPVEDDPPVVIDDPDATDDGVNECPRADGNPCL